MPKRKKKARPKRSVKAPARRKPAPAPKRSVKAPARRKPAPAPKYRRKRLLVTQPAKWFRESVRAARRADDLDIERAEAEKRQATIDYLKDSIRLLRKFYKGFEAKDGYSLEQRAITRLPAARVAKIGIMAAQLRREMSSPHVIVRPRSDDSKRALYKHTGAKRHKGRKGFVVHVESPADTTIRIEHPKGEPPRVIESRRIQGAQVDQQLFYFQDWSKGKPIRTMKDIIRAVRRMYPSLPKGYYLLVSKDYGNISVAIPKERLDEELEIYYGPYDKVPGTGQKDNRGLAESLVALRYIRTRTHVDREYKERLERRYYYSRDQKRARESRRARRRRLLTGRS